MNKPEKIRDFLKKENIHYDVLEHNRAFTALEIAQAQHLPWHQVIKSVIVHADGKQILCVLPATHKIDFTKLKKVTKTQEVSLATEQEAANLFPEVEVGAMPPFGRSAGITVYVDKGLEENEAIAFNAGTHTELLKIKFKDYIKIEKPFLADFGVHI